MGDEGWLLWADKAYFGAAIIAAFATAVTIGAGLAQNRLSSRISEQKDRNLAAYQTGAKLEISAANKAAADANERAEQASLEAAKAGVAVATLSEYVQNLQAQTANSVNDLTARLQNAPSGTPLVGRNLSSEQIVIIRSTTKANAIISIIPFMPGEPQDFANELGSAFSGIAGVQVAVGSDNMIMNGQQGLLVQYDHSNPVSSSVFLALQKAGLNPVDLSDSPGQIVYIKVAPFSN